MNPKKENHYVLGFSRRRSGAFEHSWGLAQNLRKRGYNTKYYANWWNTTPSNVNLETEEITLLDDKLSGLNGIVYLQTHTWEYNGFLDKILESGDVTTIYGLHAILPYYHMKEKEKASFLREELNQSNVKELIYNLSKREKAQLSAIEKADHLFTISKNHKRVLELFKVQKPIHVFENVSDFYDLSEEIINETSKESVKFRESIGKDNLILYCGGIYPKKGSKGLFKSFKRIREEYPSSGLILLGSGEDMKEEMIWYGLDENFIDSVTFVPWIEKSGGDSIRTMLKYFLASDVLIQPIITPELYSKSVVDAMAVGIPTITCESPYTIGSSENGEAIFNSFVKIKEDPEEVQEIVNRAKKKIASENTWDFYISRLEKIIQESK